MKSNAMTYMVRQFFEQDRAVAARSLEAMEEEQAISVLQALPPSLVAEIFGLLESKYAASVLRQIPVSLFRSVVEKLSAQQVAGLFLHLPEDHRASLLEALSEKDKKDISEILTYPENSAGRIMSADFLALHKDLLVKNAIQRIKLIARKKQTASYAYVVDETNRLVGVMNMRDLMLAPGDVALEKVMRKEVFSVSCFMDREQVAEELGKRHYFAAPVVDPEGRLLGLAKAEELLEDVREEATEDLQKMFGAGGDERAFSSIWFSLQKRLPWLHVNLATAFLAAWVVALFEDTIAKITILAVFLPVVAGQGGNAGAQSLAVVMRGLVMREIPKEKVVKLVMKEALVGLINGLVVGIVTAGVAWLWNGNPFLGVVIGLAMLVNLTLAGLFGAAIPVTMKAIGLDPAQCSNIILTTVTDVMGFLSFLGFAVLFQNHLV